ncbi:hypothetical protein N9L48_02780 [Psychrosphaera sp.]|nr:hypothetical protein [Psychrosphaera sp.]
MNSNKAVKATKSLFYFIAILIPIVVFIAAEMLLRILNYGVQQPLVTSAPKGVNRSLIEQSGDAVEYLQLNPNLIHRYFSSPELAPDVSPDTVYFRKNKSNNTFRIVIQGGSTAAGFPFGRFGSLHGMLQQRLKVAYPDKKIEIINTAMAAVNTFTLVDIQDEIIELEPDLVLIYSGHNEYLGVLGAGSVMGSQSSYSTTLMYLKLKSLRLFKLLESTYSQLAFNSTEGILKESNSENSSAGSRSVMAKAAKGQLIELNGDVYNQGLAQFSGNLDLLLSKYQQADIPVLIGNLVSIERGLAPFAASNSNLYSNAQNDFDNENYDAAKQSYVSAKDDDQLRFRAPSAFNSIIESKAKQYSAKLVDVYGRFEQSSNNKILDHTLLLEHVHPTKLGYFLLANAFYQNITEILGKPKGELSEPDALFWSPISELNEKYAELKIASLINGYPFTDTPKTIPKFVPSTALEKLLLKRLKGDNWLLLQQSLLKLYIQQNNLAEAAKVAGIIADAVTVSAESHNTAAKLFRQSNQLGLARYHQNQAVWLEPGSEKYQMNLAFDLFLANEFDASLSILNTVKKTTKDMARVMFFLEKVESAKFAYKKLQQSQE